MGKFRIVPHQRLQEWVAEEKGYFADEGLDYEFVAIPEFRDLGSRPAADGGPDEVVYGAFESMQAGRACEVSGACHWAINATSATGQGRMWGRAYSVAPGGIYVRSDSPVRRPEDLAGVEIAVGLHSGSHFSALQSLEGIVPLEQVRLRFAGAPLDRLRLMLEGRLEATNVFGPPIYVLEQHGFRKVLDTTFMVSFLVTGNASSEDMERYVNALLRAQRDIDFEPQRYKHYYLRELPEWLHPMVDVRTFGLGERIVLEPYTRSVYERTQRWLIDLGLLPLDPQGLRPYEEAVLT
jgi:NitT/TauT family transport system substrate-binding protein